MSAFSTGNAQACSQHATWFVAARVDRAPRGMANVALRVYVNATDER
jgi:hypothetical protein